jgi:hypothetical protein
LELIENNQPPTLAFMQADFLFHLYAATVLPYFFPQENKMTYQFIVPEPISAPAMHPHHRIIASAKHRLMNNISYEFVHECPVDLESVAARTEYARYAYKNPATSYYHPAELLRSAMRALMKLVAVRGEDGFSAEDESETDGVEDHYTPSEIDILSSMHRYLNEVISVVELGDGPRTETHRGIESDLRSLYGARYYVYQLHTKSLARADNDELSLSTREHMSALELAYST